ncbi:MAG: helix-turn-helix domain-containing protein [Pseudonocardiaceae bacterium]
MGVVAGRSVGSRVAALRKLAGVSLEELATAAQASVSLIQAVEQGLTPASPAFTARAAAALGLDITALTGQPYYELMMNPRSSAGGIAVLREVLCEQDDPAPIDLLLNLNVLRGWLDRLARQRFQARYTRIARDLPELLRELYVHQATPPPDPRNRELLAVLLDDAYSLAQSMCYRLGFLDLTATVDDRRALAASATGDPLRVAVAAFAQTRLLLNRGDYNRCVRQVGAVLDSIVDLPGAAARAVCGQLHLRLAIVAARDGRRLDAETHLAEAQDVVASGVPAYPYLDINCSRLNVDMHQVSVPVELNDDTTAIARAQSVQTAQAGDDDRECSRIGRYYIDLARAWILHGDRPQAWDALNTARELTPELVCYHPSAWESVYALAETGRHDGEPRTSFDCWARVSDQE